MRLLQPLWHSLTQQRAPTLASDRHRDPVIRRLDQAGFAKDAFYLHQALFSAHTTRSHSHFHSHAHPPLVLHLVPQHWDFPPQSTVDVFVYTDADGADLLLNGRSLGQRRRSGCQAHLAWRVPFVRGNLTSVAYQTTSVAGGRGSVLAPMGRSVSVLTSSAASGVAIDVEWPRAGRLDAAGADVALLTVRIVDAQSRLVPTAATPLAVEVRGPGVLIGVGNGDPTSHEIDRPLDPLRGSRMAWRGLARLLVRATGASGEIVCTVHAAALPNPQASVSIRSG